MTESVKSVSEHPQIGIGSLDLEVLLPALRRLDRLIERAVASAQVVYGSSPGADPYRGLYISKEEVGRLLVREPGAPTLTAPEGASETSPRTSVDNRSPLAWLERAFGLSPFDMDVILIALAPELDLRYQRLYAYLQDDVTRKRPSVDLVLNLLCPSAEAKLARRADFSAEALLVRHRLIHLIPDPNQLQPPLLAHCVKLDDQVVGLLLGQDGVDARVAPFCEMVTASGYLNELSLNAETKRALRLLAFRARELGRPLRLHFHGPRGVDKRRAAEALANELAAPLLVADLARALAVETNVDRVIKLLFREAWFQDAILYIDHLDALLDDKQTVAYQSLLDALAEDMGLTIVAGERPWVPAGRGSTGVIPVSFDVPAFAERRTYWHTMLAAAGIPIDPTDLDALSGRFRLTACQMTDVVATARNRALWRTAGEGLVDPANQVSNPVALADLFAAARAQSGHDLSALAQKVETLYTWNDIVLPEDALAQLREICQRVARRHRVLDEWGFDRKLSLGKGVNALFAGPSGTGKTMAAEVIANDLGLDLYKVDLSGVVSKWIGETEKNLARIFTTAENANAILFFDEADALFGKRSEVQDSHDRYANIEISYLLQKMEQFEGIAILATNLRANLDESFIRRLAFSVHFPFPDEINRRRIWSGIWPSELPLAADVDLDLLAHKFKLTGGNIKNIALAASFLAAADGRAVMMKHLLRATRREYQKMGKVLSDAELHGAQSEWQPAVTR